MRLGAFDDPLKTLVYQMKYRGRWSLGETLADRMAGEQSAAELLKGTELLVAVPLHIRRQFSRGYNQAEIVARRLGKQCGIKLVRPVKRVRDTPTQTQLRSQKARHENVRGAFKLVDPESVRGKHVVVVDDVMTSGATLQAVARELLRAQPASLCAIILAVVDPKRRDFQAI
ncbi:MAG: phosphoribosyltransferase family protein [Planctomycetota bacterium]|nr:phosphoribosyltransferase family protein [Planctomycetota bacterium]